jgi:hypothetical protein
VAGVPCARSQRIKAVRLIAVGNRSDGQHLRSATGGGRAIDLEAAPSSRPRHPQQRLRQEPCRSVAMSPTPRRQTPWSDPLIQMEWVARAVCATGSLSGKLVVALGGESRSASRVRPAAHER